MTKDKIEKVKLAFKILYAMIFLAFILFGYVIIKTDYNFELINNMGKYSADISVIFFTLTLIPGIFQRFNIANKFSRFLTIIRSNLGQTMFLFALLHYFIMKTFPLIAAGIFLPTYSNFEIFGLLALVLTIPLYLTSNKYSIKKLGKLWKKLHKLVYIIVWLVFIHVALVKINWVTLLIGLLAVAELSSLIFFYIKKRKTIKP